MARGKAWSQEEDARLTDMVIGGVDVETMSQALDRTPQAVQSRIQKLVNEKKREPSTTEKSHYIIRYLVDGSIEKTIDVTANSEKHAKIGLLKKLNEKYPDCTFDIIDVEEFMPEAQEQGTHPDNETQTKSDGHTSPNEAPKDEPDTNSGKIVKISEIQANKRVIHAQQLDLHNEDAEMKERDIDAMLYREILNRASGGPAIASLSSDGKLSVLGIEIDPEKAMELVKFCKNVEPMILEVLYGEEE